MVSFEDQRVDTAFQVLARGLDQAIIYPRSPVSTSKTGWHQSRIHDSHNFHHEKYRTPSLIYFGVSLPAGKKEDKLSTFLRVHAGAAGLDGLDLGLAPGEAAEAGRELSAVEELARGGLDRAERGAGLATDAAGGERGATERAVLLSLGPVGGERVRESSGGRGGVNARSVVHGLYGWGLASRVAGPERRGGRTRDGALAQEADQGSPGGIAESECGTHCDGDGSRCSGKRSISRRMCEIQRAR